MTHPCTLLCAALLLGAPLAEAATLTVTNLNDSGAGSLRAAITQANTSAGADTIQFQSGLSGTLTLTGGELSITDSATLAGPGAGRVTLTANGASRVFHLVNADSSDKTWAFSGLKITSGAIATASDDSGGGLFYEAGSIHADIRLTDMVFEGNTAGRKGGAVSVAGANLTLTNVTMNNNHAADGFQPSGGALFFSRGLLRVERSRIVDNSAQFGGGIRVASPGAKAVFLDTLVQGNIAEHTGGGILADTMESFTMSRSALVENMTGQPLGGGIYFAGVTDAGSAENVIENTTFSGNVSAHQFGKGSGLAVWSGNMTVRNSTFAFNATGPDTAAGAGAGGALWVSAGTTTRVTVQSTLFSGNTHGNADGSIDLTRDTGTPVSTLNVDHSLFQTLPAIGVITNATANLEGDALLADLTTAHGGLTPVHPIPADSPAIDAGTNPGNLTTDQRGAGFARTIDFNPCRRPLVNRTDIGAYEYRGDTIFCYGFND
ncbi:choice-of-anchor Q domain-containing protein [Dokdonella ginsengisoli]|uniref:Choice-of-anchor Q domain-containing protein n=1 Tax=Dokdonella ginsengisoli TaxID=363846 RepID=A0ABV9QX76_9GAMM